MLRVSLSDTFTTPKDATAAAAAATYCSVFAAIYLLVATERRAAPYDSFVHILNRFYFIFTPCLHGLKIYKWPVGRSVVAQDVEQNRSDEAVIQRAILVEEQTR